MKLLLAAHKSLVLEDCEIEFEPKKVGNVGLQFKFNSIEAKILKGSDGKIPAATTDARVAFYTQQELDLGDYTNSDTQIRVIYLWEMLNLESAARAWIVRPKAAKLYKDVDSYWAVPLSLSERRASEATRGQVRADLPIGLPKGGVQSGPDL